jgi:hypothetical protein
MENKILRKTKFSGDNLTSQHFAGSVSLGHPV